MWTAAAPEQPTRDGVEVVDLDESDAADRDAVEAVLDAGYADSFARPGVPGAEAWLGVTHRGTLAGVGVLIRQPSGAGLIRAVTVLPEHRGHGLARVLSAALAHRAVAGGNGTATLGVYTTNAPAVRVYERLGFRTAHTFVAGPTALGAADADAAQASASPSTSASTPSR
nr:GNAT family N-acetyltransferase [Nocardioides perillae]